MDPKQIEEACDRHGAKVVSDAAYKRMSGDREALRRLGLDAADIGEANHITVICHRLMSPEEQAADYGEAVVELARIGSRSG